MGGHGRTEGVVRLVVRGAVLAALTGAPLQVAAGEPTPDPGPTREFTKPVPQVRFHDLYSAKEVRAALRGAGERLAKPSCQEVVSEFRDVAGRPLEDALEELRAPADEYLQGLLFYSGSAMKACKTLRVLAFTTPGSRIVFVCQKQFRKAYRRDPSQAEFTIIHEMLHSLGLGENPPTPGHITSRVVEHCRG
jgi:hypothetical protein